ncbi:hypothetical protein HKW98_10790 [Stutzerimonas urumqiensis]|uniref:hypothetical protein n=1 Tax=Stutzerimonas urumqiensis TaxID=638269 RepID=UPI003BA8B492
MKAAIATLLMLCALVGCDEPAERATEVRLPPAEEPVVPEPVVTAPPTDAIEPVDSIEPVEPIEPPVAEVPERVSPIGAPAVPEEAEQAVRPPETAPQTVARKPVDEVEVEAPEIDLSLPEDWAEELEPAEPVAEPALLPELFDGAEGDRIGMSGRLIPGEADDSMVDGAELRIEIRR